MLNNWNEEDYSKEKKKKWGLGDNEPPKVTGRIEKVEETPANILYRDSKNDKIKEEKEKNYKNVLLDTLGNLATPADILYSNAKKLEQKIKDNDLTKKLKEKFQKPQTGDYGFDRSPFNIYHYDKLSKEYDKELGDFLRENTNNPEEYSNDLRHQYVSAIYARNLGEFPAKIMGNLNEIRDSGSEPGDSEIDQINNELGREYGKNYPEMPRKELLKKLLEDHDENRQYRIREIEEKRKKEKEKSRELW